ncbi:MAG: methionyl-tRNA formyltransferase, partial [Paludibacter sp.]|nr:methionyl-tRNA formyltransferase [Paludibacter sp.]
GETKTGVTTFFIDDKIDTGAMIMSSEIEIDPIENAGHLHDRLMHLGSETVISTLELIEKGNVTTTIQKDSSDIKSAFKLNKENCKIDWTKSASEINNLIRGLSPYPAAWCIFSDKKEEWNVKIYDAKIVLEDHGLDTGIMVCTKKEMKIAVENGFIQVLSLQFPGKKKMTTPEFLNGITFSADAKVY